MPEIDNDDFLNNVLLIEFKDIIDEVTNEVLEKLKEIIDQEVYSKGNPSKYDRQMDDGGLRGSFIIPENSNIVGQLVQSHIEHDPNSMTHDPDNFIHGSNSWKYGNDVRDFLADMIINGGSGTPHVGDKFGSGFWTSARDFWTPFLQILEDGTIDRIIENQFNNRGIEWVKS
jgi:hypothetical protein